jgi:hypothetical protein
MDVRKLKGICEVALPLVEEVDYSKPTPKALLSALIAKTIHLIGSEGLNSDDIMFTSSELIALVKTGKYSDSQVSKFKADHYSEVVKLLSQVNLLMDEKGLSDSKYRIELSDTGEKGGAKNKKHHFLKLISIEGEQVVGQSIQSKTVEYQAVQLPKASWYVKPFKSIELSAWRLFLFISLPIVLMVIIYFLFIQPIFTPTSIELLILFSFAGFYFWVWRIVLPFYEANTMRIAIAPLWMIKLSQVTAQIESVPLDRLRKTGRPYRRLEFVIYEGKCPICQNRVEVEKGKGQFKGRLIGMCSESPREHKFSFDHITKKGVLLTGSI